MLEKHERLSLSFVSTGGKIEDIFLVDDDGEHIDVVLDHEGLLGFINRNYIPKGELK